MFRTTCAANGGAVTKGVKRMTVRLLVVLGAAAIVLACVLGRRRDAIGHLLHGDRLSGRDQDDQAIAAYDEALKRDPTLVGAHLGKARSLKRNDDMQQAQACYQDAIAAAGEDNVRRGEIMVESAELHEREGEHEEAFELYQRVLGFWPENAAAGNGVARSHMRLGRYDEAAEIYAAQLRVDESDIDALRGLADAHREMGRADEALAGYGRYLNYLLSQSHPRSDVAHTLMEIGDAYAQFGRFDDAYQAYAKAHAQMPGWPAPFSSMGDALADDGKLDTATESYEKALEMDAEGGAAWCGLGAVHRLAGRTDESLEACRRAIGINPQFAAGHLELGRIHQAMRQTKLAAEAFEEAARLDPHGIVGREARQAAEDVDSLRLDEA